MPCHRRRIGSQITLIGASLIGCALALGCGGTGDNGAGASVSGSGGGASSSDASSSSGKASTSATSSSSSSTGSGGGGGSASSSSSSASTSASSTSSSSGAGGGPDCVNDADCNDNDACTVDSCAQGSCAHPPLDFDDHDACTTDSCDPVTGPKHDAIPIDDNDACTIDTCDKVTGPKHDPVDLDDHDACTLDMCDPVTGPSHPPIPLDDNDACTDDLCDPLTGPSHPPKSCDDNDICTLDLCAPATGCSHPPAIYFSETFADNSKGWSLGGLGTGTPWEIGPALPNPTFPAFGNPDPTMDHTVTADNGVAGVSIGGNTGNAVHGPYYLTSPIIDLSQVQTAVSFEYWRWLNADLPPYMDSTIEVYNGASWVKVFGMTQGFSITDDAWTKQVFDVTSYKNANFRIRWGWQVNQQGAQSSSGWNVDDVRLLPPNCP